MSDSSNGSQETKDEEKGLLSEEHCDPGATEAQPLNIKLWVSIGLNTLATVAIVS